MSLVAGSSAPQLLMRHVPEWDDLDDEVQQELARASADREAMLHKKRTLELELQASRARRIEAADAADAAVKEAAERQAALQAAESEMEREISRQRQLEAEVQQAAKAREAAELRRKLALQDAERAKALEQERLKLQRSLAVAMPAIELAAKRAETDLKRVNDQLRELEQLSQNVEHDAQVVQTQKRALEQPEKRIQLQDFPPRPELLQQTASRSPPVYSTPLPMPPPRPRLLPRATSNRNLVNVSPPISDGQDETRKLVGLLQAQQDRIDELRRQLLDDIGLGGEPPGLRKIMTNSAALGNELPCETSIVRPAPEMKLGLRPGDYELRVHFFRKCGQLLDLRSLDASGATVRLVQAIVRPPHPSQPNRVQVQQLPMHSFGNVPHCSMGSDSSGLTFSFPFSIAPPGEFHMFLLEFAGQPGGASTVWALACTDPITGPRSVPMRAMPAEPLHALQDPYYAAIDGASVVLEICPAGSGAIPGGVMRPVVDEADALRALHQRSVRKPGDSPQAVAGSSPPPASARPSDPSPRKMLPLSSPVPRTGPGKSCTPVRNDDSASLSAAFPPRRTVGQSSPNDRSSATEPSPSPKPRAPIKPTGQPLSPPQQRQLDALDEVERTKRAAHAAKIAELRQRWKDEQGRADKRAEALIPTSPPQGNDRRRPEPVAMPMDPNVSNTRGLSQDVPERRATGAEKVPLMSKLAPPQPLNAVSKILDDSAAPVDLHAINSISSPESPIGSSAQNRREPEKSVSQGKQEEGPRRIVVKPLTIRNPDNSDATDESSPVNLQLVDSLASPLNSSVRRKSVGAKVKPASVEPRKSFPSSSVPRSDLSPYVSPLDPLLTDLASFLDPALLASPFEGSVSGRGNSLTVPEKSVDDFDSANNSISSVSPQARRGSQQLHVGDPLHKTPSIMLEECSPPDEHVSFTPQRQPRNSLDEYGDGAASVREGALRAPGQVGKPAGEEDAFRSPGHDELAVPSSLSPFASPNDLSAAPKGDDLFHADGGNNNDDSVNPGDEKRRRSKGTKEKPASVTEAPHYDSVNLPKSGLTVQDDAAAEEGAGDADDPRGSIRRRSKGTKEKPASVTEAPHYDSVNLPKSGLTVQDDAAAEEGVGENARRSSSIRKRTKGSKDSSLPVSDERSGDVAGIPTDGAAGVAGKKREVVYVVQVKRRPASAETRPAEAKFIEDPQPVHLSLPTTRAVEELPRDKAPAEGTNKNRVFVALAKPSEASRPEGAPGELKTREQRETDRLKTEEKRRQAADKVAKQSTQATPPPNKIKRSESSDGSFAQEGGPSLSKTLERFEAFSDQPSRRPSDAVVDKGAEADSEAGGKIPPTGRPKRVSISTDDQESNRAAERKKREEERRRQEERRREAEEAERKEQEHNAAADNLRRRLSDSKEARRRPRELQREQEELLRRQLEEREELMKPENVLNRVLRKRDSSDDSDHRRSSAFEEGSSRRSSTEGKVSRRNSFTVEPMSSAALYKGQGPTNIGRAMIKTLLTDRDRRRSLSLTATDENGVPLMLSDPEVEVLAG
jgi:hypothetical protein